MELITAVHDAEVQGRGCHPRSQAMGFTCWTHIRQCPLGLRGSQLPLHSVSSNSSSSTIRLEEHRHSLLSKDAFSSQKDLRKVDSLFSLKQFLQRKSYTKVFYVFLFCRRWLLLLPLTHGFNSTLLCAPAPQKSFPVEDKTNGFPFLSSLRCWCSLLKTFWELRSFREGFPDSGPHGK